MKKTTIIKGSSIVGILVLIISIFGNFYAPIDCDLKMTASVNLNNALAQPIFMDKHYGVTYVLMGEFTIDTVSKEVKNINFIVNRLSGLANVKVDDAKIEKEKYQIQVNDTITKDTIGDVLKVYLSYGISKGNCPKDFSNLTYNPDKPMNMPVYVKYKKLFSFKTGEERYYDYDVSCDITVPDIYPITQSRGGRICDLNCIHE